MEIHKINSLIRFYFGIDPDPLNDDAWCKRWGELQFALRFDLQRSAASNTRQMNQLLGG